MAADGKHHQTRPSIRMPKLPFMAIRLQFALVVAAFGMSACATRVQESPAMQSPFTAESVVQFLNHFEELAQGGLDSSEK